MLRLLYPLDLLYSIMRVDDEITYRRPVSSGINGQEMYHP